MNFRINDVLLAYLSTEQAESGNIQPGSWIISVYPGLISGSYEFFPETWSRVPAGCGNMSRSCYDLSRFRK
jgi:hypothetical protein